MPPKKSRSPSKSPVKAPGRKAPAGSVAVAKAKGGTSPVKKRSSTTSTTVVVKSAAPAPSPPAKKSSTGKTTSGVSPTSKKVTSLVTSKKLSSLTQEEASLIIQSVGRAYSDRQFQGSKYYRRLRSVIADQTESANTKRLLLERQRRQKEKAITQTVEEKRIGKRKLQEDLCSAAFDGDVRELTSLIETKGCNPCKADLQGNYPVGEAAVNGQAAMVKLLVEKYGCDPNSRGTFDRTPLWRASFNSHADTVQQLLELGADPRLKAQSQIPAELASGDAAKHLVLWDVKKTEGIQAMQLALREEREQLLNAEAAKELDKLGDVTENARVLYQAATKNLSHAKCSYERKIYEYDMTKHEIALNIVKEAEKDIETAEKQRDEAMNVYLDAKALEGEHRNQLGELPGEEVGLRQFAEIVMKDGKQSWQIKYNPESPDDLYSGPTTRKWPLVIDCTDKVGLFLRYRNTNYVDAINPVQMGPEKLRVALLGSIRWGKPLVLDMKDVPLVELVQEKFNAILGGNSGDGGVSKKSAAGAQAPLPPAFSVWDALMCREILKPEKYLKLVNEEVDGDRYEPHRFQRSVVAEFALIVLTTAFVVEDEFVQMFTPFRVVDEF